MYKHTLLAVTAVAVFRS